MLAFNTAVYCVIPFPVFSLFVLHITVVPDIKPQPETPAGKSDGRFLLRRPPP